jgi:D-alanine-D-alanine ligase
MNIMKIAVLFGGISSERNVSIEGGKAVVEALRSKGHTVVPIDPALGADVEKQKALENMLNDISKFPSIEELAQYSTKDILACTSSSLFDDIDCAFLVLHGPNGEDGLIQAVFELRGIPYTGSGVRGSATAINKVASKIMMESCGILTPEWAIVTREQLEDYNLYTEIRNYLGEDLIVKPCNQGSTIGLTHIVKGNLDDIHNACVKAAELSRLVLVERYIEGREITVAVIGDKAYPIVEIEAEDGMYDYDAKYAGHSTNYICPADLDDNTTEFIQEQALLLHNTLGCQGFTRVDFRLDDEFQPYCLELNTIPGFTTRSLVPMAAKEAGLDFAELCEEIIEIAVNQHSA